MPSFKHEVLKRTLNTLSLPMYMALPPINHLRALLETFTMFSTLPWGVDLSKVDIDGITAEYLEPNDANKKRVILYLHGGGFVIGSPHSHRGLAGKIAKLTMMNCLLIDYRKAPEHQFPCALDDSYEAYLYLLDQGFKAKDIVLIGDSAGGGLVASLQLKLKLEKQPLPRASILLSPYVNLANDSDSRDHNAKNDRFLDVFEMRRWAKLYAGEHDLYDPLISPIYGDFKGLPPMLIQCSESEVLYDDGKGLYEKTKKVGVEVEIQTWKGLIHWWHMFGGMPEAKEAIEKIVEFVDKQFEGQKLKPLDQQPRQMAS